MRSDCTSGLRFVVSHPCAEEMAQGWDTQVLRLVRQGRGCR